MHPLETYYLNQAGLGLSPTPGIGPIYSPPLYLQLGHGIGNFLGTIFRFVRPLLWTVGRTCCKINTDIVKNDSPDVRAEDIISKHVGDAVTESTQRLISKLRARGLKRVRRETLKGRGGKKPKTTPAKRARVIKRISSSSLMQSHHVCRRDSVRK